ncbi:hypothetical protein ACK3YV_13960 [Aeromonas caviae]
MAVKFDNCTLMHIKNVVIGPSTLDIEFKETKAFHIENMVKLHESKAEILERIGLNVDTPDEAIHDAMNRLYQVKDDNQEAKEEAIRSSSLSGFLADAANITTIVTFFLTIFASK